MYNGGDVYALLYSSDYNIANLKEIADKIRNEKKAIISAFNMKNVLDTGNLSSVD